MSGVVYRPQGPHSCDLPGGIETIGEDYRKDTVWRCDCGTTWVSQGITGGGLQRSGGYASGGLTWKREGKRARRKRERQGVTPEQVFGAYSGGKPASEVGPPPRVPSAALIPTHNRAITDRLKAAERCVLAIQEALTGEKPDGVLDYDQTCEHLLSRIGIVGLDGIVVLDPKLVDVATADGRVVGYRYHGALPCPEQQPADPVE